MKQFPSCCQSENKEIQVPLGWPAVIVFADSWSTDEQMGSQIVFDLMPSRFFPLWWSCLDSNSNHSGGS